MYTLIIKGYKNVSPGLNGVPLTITFDDIENFDALVELTLFAAKIISHINQGKRTDIEMFNDILSYPSSYNIERIIIEVDEEN